MSHYVSSYARGPLNVVVELPPTRRQVKQGWDPPAVAAAASTPISWAASASPVQRKSWMDTIPARDSKHIGAVDPGPCDLPPRRPMTITASTFTMKWDLAVTEVLLDIWFPTTAASHQQLTTSWHPIPKTWPGLQAWPIRPPASSTC